MRPATRTALFRAGLGVSVCAAVVSFLPSQAATPKNLALSSPSTQVRYTAAPQSAKSASSALAEPTNRRLAGSGPAVVLQSSFTGREAGEPTLGVDKKGTVFFPGDTFDTPGGELARNVEFRSTDGGKSWSDVSPKVANVGPDSHPVTLDTITYVDKDYGRVFTVDTYAAEGSAVSFSDDRGATWTSSFAPAAGVNDHETIAAGVVPEGSPLVTLDAKFPKIVYYCVNTVAAVSCSRSLDGGITFTQMGTPFPTHPTQSLPLSALCSSLTGHLQTDLKGDVFLPSAFNEVAGCGVPAVAVSTDGGTTWVDHQISQIHDPFNAMALGVDPQGNLYVVWQDDKWNLPYLSTSHDMGAHWSKPVMVAPPNVKVTNFPSLAVGDKGRVVITFPGSTDPRANNDNQHSPWSYYVTFSQNALSSRPTFVSQVAAVPASLGGGTTMHRGACNGRCGGLFDFLDVQTAPTAGGAAYASLSDDCTGACTKSPVGKSNDASAGAGILVREVAGPAMTGKTTALRKQPNSLAAPGIASGLLLLPIGMLLFRKRLKG
jgi:hypothetical protein